MPRIYLEGIAWPIALRPRFSRSFGGDLLTRPVLLAVLAVLPRQFLRLFVDTIEYRQAVGEAPQNEPESLSARPPAFIGFLD